MSAQLRRYRISAGNASLFAEEWRRGVLPLRRRYGFRVEGWLVDGTDEFVWLLQHDDRETFDAADAAYYASTERRSLQPDPARLIEEARQDWLTPID